MVVVMVSGKLRKLTFRGEEGLRDVRDLSTLSFPRISKFRINLMTSLTWTRVVPNE